MSRLHETVARLERESAAHIRRCAELQLEIDVLRRLVVTLAGSQTPSPAQVPPVIARRRAF